MKKADKSMSKSAGKAPKAAPFMKGGKPAPKSAAKGKKKG